MAGEVHDGVWRLPFLVARVIDADTIAGDADLGWAVWKRNLAVRVERLWAPELGTPEGDAAAAWARAQLPPGRRLTLHSRWVLSFARVVGSLYLEDGSSYADRCAGAGHGVLA